MNQTTELTFSFRVPGCGIASALAGLIIAARVEKLLSENGCALQLGHIHSVRYAPVTCETVRAEPDTNPAPETPAPAEATPAPEPEKPKRTRKAAEPKPETPPVQEQPAPEPEKAPEAPAADLMDGNICCEHLTELYRTGNSEAAAAKIPGGWTAIPGFIQARGYTGLTAIKAALNAPETAAKATADVNAILAEARASYAELEKTIAAKKEAEASELD